MTELRVHVSEETAARLAAQAAEQGTSTEDVAADLLTQHAPATPLVARAFGFVGIGSSGRSDISERAEEILRADFGR